MRKNNKIMKLISGSVYDLPVPINLSYLWNFGSLMGLCLVIQIMSGLFLAIHYTPSADLAFDSVWMISRVMNHGWLLRSCHANGASAFFVCIYIHIGRGLYYHSFSMSKTWSSGVVMFLLLMAIAFTGYVLPWGQMSFWGATVITNMITALPYGTELIKYVWGGEVVGDPTLKRFFIFHFISPFILGLMAGIHMAFLHDSGSGNPLGVSSEADCIPFFPYFVLKDFFGAIVFLVMFFMIVLVSPDMFGVPDNFFQADSMKTPVHIEPEWYFLFAYSILRSIDDKVSGIVLMFGSMLIMFILPRSRKTMIKGSQFNFLGQIWFWVFVVNFFLLTYIGTRDPEEPYNSMAGMCTKVHYGFFLTYIPVCWVWERIYIGDDFSGYESENNCVGTLKKHFPSLVLPADFPDNKWEDTDVVVDEVMGSNNMGENPGYWFHVQHHHKCLDNLKSMWRWSC